MLLTDLTTGDLANAAGWKLNGLFSGGFFGLEGVKYEVRGSSISSTL